MIGSSFSTLDEWKVVDYTITTASKNTCTKQYPDRTVPKNKTQKTGLKKQDYESA